MSLIIHAILWYHHYLYSLLLWNYMHSSLIWYFVLASPNTYLLHQELLNFMLIAMSTQLLSGPKPGQNDVHPFLGAAMDQVTMRIDPIFNMNLVYCCCWLDRSCYIRRKVLWLVQLSVNCYLITWCDLNSQMVWLIPYILKEVNLVFCKELVLQLVCLLEFNWSGYSFSLIFPIWNDCFANCKYQSMCLFVVRWMIY